MSVPRGFTHLQVESWSNAVRTVRVSGIIAGIPFVHEHTTAGDRSLVSELFSLDTHKHSLPLTVNASVAATVLRGELYVRISVMWSNSIVQRLSAAYLTGGKTIAWPPGVFEGFTEGPGLIRMITGTNPAAGAEMTEAVPTNTRWRIITVRLQLTTDGTAIGRRVNLIVDNGVTTFYYDPSPQEQAATNVYRYTWFNGAGREATVVNDYIQSPFPNDIYLPAGFRIRTITVGIQAGDDYAIPYLIIEEWIEE